MLFPSQVSPGVTDGPPLGGPQKRPLTEVDAIQIWIARWLRIRRKDLLIRYGCDPRRLYEIWEETRFPGSRAKAMVLLKERYPGFVGRIDHGRHRRIQRTIPPQLQPDLFEAGTE